MLRRHGLAVLVGCLLGLAADLLGSAVHAADPPRNLLVIMTDEHNFRTLGCYRALLPPSQALMWGPAVVETPQLDWLASQGAICTSFYATTPVCSPSRAALVSGRYPHNVGVPVNDVPMNDDVVTFAALLGRQGYATGYAGKWHLEGAGKPQWAPQRNFGFHDNRYMFNRGHWKQLEDTPDGPQVAAWNARGEPTYDIIGATEQNFTTDFLCDKTVQFIEAHRNEPFCFMVSLPDPHGPDTVRPPYDTMFDTQTYEQPRSARKPDAGLPSWGTKQQGSFDMASYYGMVRCIDDNVGKILAALRRLELLERTAIVFTSDHGDLRGEHHRHNKGVPYEASTRVPFLLYCPGKVAPGTVIPQALGSVDFLPTILALLEQPAASVAEGRDASPLFLRRDVPWQDICVVRGTGQRQGWLSVLTDRYKLVYSPVDPPWLFDLERDPDEVTNFFEHAGYRQVVQELATQLHRYAAERSDPFAQLPRIAFDLDWSIHGTGAYQPPNDILAPPRGKRKARSG